MDGLQGKIYQNGRFGRSYDRCASPESFFIGPGAECQMFQGDTAIQEVMEDMKSSTLW